MGEQYSLLSGLAGSVWATLERAKAAGLNNPDNAISVLEQSLNEQRRRSISRIDEAHLSEERIDPQTVDAAFEAVAQAKWPTYEGKSGRKPVRLQRIREGFRGRENEHVALDDLAVAFEGKQNPRKYAASTISWLNNAFKELDINLEIKSTTTVYRGEGRPVSTRYRFCRRA